MLRYLSSQGIPPWASEVRSHGSVQHPPQPSRHCVPQAALAHRAAPRPGQFQSRCRRALKCPWKYMSIVTRHMAPHVMASERTGQAADRLVPTVGHSTKCLYQINNRSICCIDAHSLREKMHCSQTKASQRTAACCFGDAQCQLCQERLWFLNQRARLLASTGTVQLPSYRGGHCQRNVLI